MFRLALVCFCLMMVSSCIFRPNYERPSVDIPDSWRLPTNESCCYANIRWWEALGDPVLNALIIEALENNNDLKVAIASVDQYYGQFGAVYSQQFPQINGTASAIRQQFTFGGLSIPFLENMKRFNIYSALLTASFEIDFWGRLAAASDAALALYFAQIQTRRTVVLTIVSAVANAYVTLRQYDEQLKVARETLKSFIASQQLETDRFEGGAISLLPVQQARSETDAAALQVEQLEIRVAQQENLLSVLLGRNPQSIERGKMLQELIQPPCVPAGIPSDILEQRPDVMNAELNLIATHSNVGVAKANFFPQISLTGNYGNQSLSLKNLFTGNALTWQYGVTINQPLFNGGYYISQLEIATAEESMALYTYYNAILNAFRSKNPILCILDFQKCELFPLFLHNLFDL